jgi:hypothetical protein
MTDPQYKPGDIANGHRLTKKTDGSLVWEPLGSGPQHQLGDIANGHRLTTRPDGSLVWLPVGADPQPRKWRRGLWITLGAVGAVLLLFIVIGSLNLVRSSEPAPVAVSGFPSEDPEPSAEPEPEPEMVAVPPGLVGMTAQEAYNALAAVGLTAVYDGEPTARVLSVSPAAAEVVTPATLGTAPTALPAWGFAVQCLSQSAPP